MTGEQRKTLASFSQMILMAVRQTIDTAHDSAIDQHASFEEERLEQVSLHLLAAIETLGQVSRVPYSPLETQLEESIRMIKERNNDADRVAQFRANMGLS